MRAAVSVVTAALCFAATGCSSSSEEPGGAEGTPAADGGDPGLIPELAPPTRGFQLRTKGKTIGSGEDVEYCEVVTLPGATDETYYVQGFDMAMTEFSHHLIVTAVNVGSAAEAALEDGSVVACLGAQGLADFQNSESVTGSQTPTASYAFPDGIGKIYHGGQKFIFDYHYLNTSKNDVPARHALNVLTTDASDVKKIVQRMAFVNVTINTPAHEKAAFTGECRFSHDVLVGSLLRHTHKWGGDFDVWYAGGPDDGKHLWTSTDYELDANYVYDEARLMKSGEGYRFQCNYDNTTDGALTFGPKATNEMCILFGGWWVVNEGEDPVAQTCLMTSISPDGVAHGSGIDPGGTPQN